MNTTKQYTDEQLKQALANLWPEKLIIYSGSLCEKPEDFYIRNELPTKEYEDTELLHLCWLVEADLSDELAGEYGNTLADNLKKQYTKQERESMSDGLVYKIMLNLSWQQRVIYLCKVKNIEIA